MKKLEKILLENKSLTQLRSIAQGMGVIDIFSKDETKLRQDIGLKQQELQPVAKIEIAQPPYDARLMTKAPSKRASRAEIDEALREHVASGLKISFTEENWKMSFGVKNDMGTIRMSLRTVIQCANAVMK